MAEQLSSDIHEHILVRLCVNDLIRFKSVCKSWYMLISSPRFVKFHLNRYNANKIGYEKMFIAPFIIHIVTGVSKIDYTCHVVGSSNGLVCIARSNTELYVVNPLTKDVKKLKTPRIPYNMSNSYLCCGFGYDSSIDDYKVVLGSNKGEDQTCFQVISLKSNVWKSIGNVKYSFINRVGVLFNGALHWFFMNGENRKQLILSFDLCKEEFQEIPQPNDARYECTIDSVMAVIDDCLCIFRRHLKGHWVMKSYNVKESWAFITDNDNNSAHYSETQKDYITPESSLSHIKIHMSSSNDDSHIRLSSSWNISSHVFVESLVSPLVNTSSKLIRRDPSVPGWSATV